MTPEQALAMVSSKRSADRRIAGREIASNPTLIDRAALEAAYHSETVPQIRDQFAAALHALGGANVAASDEPPADQVKAIFDDAYVKSLRDLTERVLHQVNPLVGDIEQAAFSEIDDFPASTTNKALIQLRRQLDAITKLYNATKAAAFEEFDLAGVVRDCLPHDLEFDRCRLNFIGTTPLVVKGDPSLITIAVTNGLRNAIEACIPIARDDHKPQIIVNWEATDRDYWISIIDEGVGIHGQVSGAFEIGTSTKGHKGQGLPALKAAMLSMSGSVELVPHKDRGCTLKLSWPAIGLDE